MVPIDRLHVWLNDANFADCEMLSDEEYNQIDNSQRIAFARALFSNIGDHLDADLHPGLLALSVTDGKTESVLGYAITGYGFSGIDIDCIGYGRDQAALCKNLADEYLLIDDSFFMATSVDAAVAGISDEFILTTWKSN